MTPEQSKRLWGRSAKGPEHGQWVDAGGGSLVWRCHPRPARTAPPQVKSERARKREVAHV